MAAAVTVTWVDATQNQFIVYGTITLSGSYPAHGETVNLSTFDLIKSGSPANAMSAFEAPAAGVSASGYVLVLVPGATLATNKLQIFTSNGAAAAALAEFPAGAYGSPLTGAVIKFQAFIPSL